MHSPDYQLWAKLFFRLLPYQVLLLIVDAANGITDTICASNMIGQTMMNAIGLYAPLNHFLFAVSIMLVSGSQIMVGKAMGRNRPDSIKSYFSSDLILAVMISCVISLLMIVASLTDATSLMVKDASVRPVFNSYLLGQAFGIPGLVLGQQFFAFLSMENKRKRTMAASMVSFFTNLVMDLLLVGVFRMGGFGLGLASAIAVWAFCAVMLTYYLSGQSQMKFSVRSFDRQASITIFARGYAGAISRFVEMFRCLIVNMLILQYVGNDGLSAFAAVNSVMAVFWPVVFGMAAVTRMLLSITIGEEDKQSVIDIMRISIFRGGLLVCGVCALIIALEVPFTNMFYHDPTAPVYQMTMMGFRILPLCMPFSVLSQSFSVYSQAMKRKVFATILPIVNGAVSVVVFSFILIPAWGMNGLYAANILNGVVCLTLIYLNAIIGNRKFPRNVEGLLVFPETFGVPEDKRIDIGVREFQDVGKVSENVHHFCLREQLDKRRSYFASLALEEIAGNALEHGFIKDSKKHEVAIRVVHKDDAIIIRVLDDCRRFNPLERISYVDDSDPVSNIGIRIVYSIAEDVQYQNLLGLNVLTMRL